MPIPEATTPPERGELHAALDVFLGRWRAEGWSYGGPKQDPANPKAQREKWESTHTASWHTGQFFLVQDERATTADRPFDTLSVMGVDAQRGSYYAQSFENHGFARFYTVKRDGRTWTFDGATERARIEFSADGQQQTLVWEWRKDGQWLPLCDRVATRIADA